VGPVTGAILAGGRATRFGGRPKGLERVDGTRILDRVADALRAVTPDVMLVANAPDAPSWLPGTRVVPDVHRGCGSLAALHAALAHADSPVLVVAWDMPFVSSALLTTLLGAAHAGVDAVLPLGEHGPEPLCAWYASSCLAVAERLLGAGERRARALGEAVGAAHLDLADHPMLGDPHAVLTSVNTPDDLSRANGLARTI
jgi:molybdopterin-guanine dinucleotide biosynthesis protein A